MDCGPPGSSVRGISQARILEWVAKVAMPFSRGSCRPRFEPAIRARRVDSILLRHLGSPAIHIHVSVLLQWFCLLDSTAAAAEGSCCSQRERVLAGETCRAESIGPCPSPACKPPSSAPYWQGLQNTCLLRTT